MTNSMYLILGVVGLTLGFVFIYNALIFRKNGIEQSFGAIQAYMKKRADLIPNLVSVVGEFADHEKGLLTEITKLRACTVDPSIADGERIATSDQLSGLMKQLMFVVENYPDLKSSKSFQDLQQTLVGIETQLSAARRSYNAAVVHYNNGVEMIPYSFVAAFMGLKKQKVFEADSGEQGPIAIAEQFEMRKTGS